MVFVLNLWRQENPHFMSFNDSVAIRGQKECGPVLCKVKKNGDFKPDDDYFRRTLKNIGNTYNFVKVYNNY